MSSSSILTLCTGNICRSPVAQAVLSTALVGTGISVNSAGTHAAVDAAASPEAISYIRTALDVEFDHHARRLNRGYLTRSDLVLTMTIDQRRWVASEEPRALRRTFTMVELAQIVSELPPGERFEDLRAFAHSCAQLRTRFPVSAKEQDIADPYGGPADGYIRSFTEVHAAAGVIAQAIIRTVAPDHRSVPTPPAEESS